MNLQLFFISLFLFFILKKFTNSSISSSIEASCRQSAGIAFAMTRSYESDIIAINILSNIIGMIKQNIVKTKNLKGNSFQYHPAQLKRVRMII